MKNFRKYSLIIAETIDAWRIVPRVLVVSYAYLVANLYWWFISIKTYSQTSCDADVLKTLLDVGRKLEEAQLLACTVVGIVGGPTVEQTAFVTTITGLSAAIFGLYASTGRKWGGGVPRSNYDSADTEFFDNEYDPRDRGGNRRRNRDFPPRIYGEGEAPTDEPM